MTRGVCLQERSLGATVSVPRIRTERLVLRAAQPADRDGLIELGTDAQVRAHLGGPAPRDEVERALDERPLDPEHPTPGKYVIADPVTDILRGMISLDRRAPERPGHIVDDGGELELSYVLLRSAWRRGYATEACRALLGSAAQELPDQPVVLVTQSANAASLRLAERLGFTCVGTFVEFHAEQTLAVAPLTCFVPAPS